MRVVGTFYLLLFVAGAIIQAPVVATLAQAGIDLDPSNFAHRFLVDVWVMFALELGVVGAALWVASGRPHQNRILAWSVSGSSLSAGSSAMFTC